MLDGWLDYHRGTLLWKCEGLTPEQLCERSVPPAIMSLAGLVRHMADVERNWFQRTLAGEDAPGLFWSDEPGSDPDGDFTAAAPESVAADFEVYRGEVARARANAAAVTSLAAIGKRKRHGEDISLRWIYTHMIEEYARHNGHADFLRERIDGAVGD
ncbi:MAG: DinB family protein [Actinomycetota bacterium]